jgi:hypothetical protein
MNEKVCEREKGKVCVCVRESVCECVFNSTVRWENSAQPQRDYASADAYAAA